MKVLIVDDEKNIVQLIKRGLNMEGYETAQAYCGSEALQKIATERPDIVLLDVMMPDMDGYEVLQKIQEYDETIPIIFITAQGKNYKRIAALELGADDFITKPLNMKELTLKIKVLWRRINYSRQPVSDNKRLMEYGDLVIMPEFAKPSFREKAESLPIRNLTPYIFWLPTILRFSQESSS